MPDTITVNRHFHCKPYNHARLPLRTTQRTVIMLTVATHEPRKEERKFNLECLILLGYYIMSLSK